MNEVKDITLDDILIWVIQNKRDTDAMDKINVATYPYTAKFLARRSDNKANNAPYGDTKPASYENPQA